MERSEKDKMLAGELYNASDLELVAARAHARALCQKFNDRSSSATQSELSSLLAQLFGAPTDTYVTPPFYCDYGTSITLGRNVYFNFNCVVLDGAKVTIGNNVLFGPAVQIYTASHPMTVSGRGSGLEFSKPVAIGNDVWIGGGAIVCPGVCIADGSVIGAGSVVLRDIPAGVLAAGNPCRVVRTL